MDSTVSQIHTIVTDALSVDENEFDVGTELAALEGWDSLRQLNVMMAIEESLGITMDPEDLSAMTSVRSIAEIVDSRMA